MLIVALLVVVLVTIFAVINGALFIAAILTLVSDRIGFIRLALYSVGASVLLTVLAYALYMSYTMEVFGQGQYGAFEQRMPLAHPAFGIAYIANAILGVLALAFWFMRVLRSFQRPGRITQKVLALTFLMAHLFAYGLFTFLVMQ